VNLQLIPLPASPPTVSSSYKHATEVNFVVAGNVRRLTQSVAESRLVPKSSWQVHTNGPPLFRNCVDFNGLAAPIPLPRLLLAINIKPRECYRMLLTLVRVLDIMFVGVIVKNNIMDMVRMVK
jgi:hypothetical protein